MQIKKSKALMGIAAGTLGLVVLGGGAAHAATVANASNSQASTPAAVQSTAGNVSTGSSITGSSTSHSAQREQGGEAPENSAESHNESASQSDGPGGHQDPAGDVQHQGGGNEM